MGGSTAADHPLRWRIRHSLAHGFGCRTDASRPSSPLARSLPRALPTPCPFLTRCARGSWCGFELVPRPRSLTRTLAWQGCSPCTPARAVGPCTPSRGGRWDTSLGLLKLHLFARVLRPRAGLALLTHTLAFASPHDVSLLPPHPHHPSKGKGVRCSTCPVPRASFLFSAEQFCSRLRLR